MKKGQHSTYEWVIWEAPNGDWKQADTIDYLDTERSGYEHAMRYLSDSREEDIQAIEFRKTIWQSEEKGAGLSSWSTLTSKTVSFPRFLTLELKYQNGSRKKWLTTTRKTQLLRKRQLLNC